MWLSIGKKLNVKYNGKMFRNFAMKLQGKLKTRFADSIFLENTVKTYYILS